MREWATHFSPMDTLFEAKYLVLVHWDGKERVQSFAYADGIITFQQFMDALSEFGCVFKGFRRLKTNDPNNLTFLLQGLDQGGHELKQIYKRKFCRSWSPRLGHVLEEPTSQK